MVVLAEPVLVSPLSELRQYLDGLSVGHRLWLMEFFQHLFGPAATGEVSSRWDLRFGGLDADGLEGEFEALRLEAARQPYLAGLHEALRGNGAALDCFLDALTDVGGVAGSAEGIDRSGLSGPGDRSGGPAYRSAEGSLPQTAFPGMVKLLKHLAEDAVIYRDLPELPESALLERYQALLRRLLVVLNDEESPLKLYPLNKLALERFDEDFQKWTAVKPHELTRQPGLAAQFKDGGAKELAEESLFNPYRGVRMRALMVMERLANETCPDPVSFVERLYQRIGRNLKPRQRATFLRRVPEIEEQLPGIHLDLPDGD